MNRLIRHIEKRIEIGQRPYTKGAEGNNNLLELHRYDEFIVKDVLRLYTAGVLQRGRCSSASRRESSTATRHKGGKT